MPAVNEYVAARQKRIEENKRRMQELGLLDEAEALKQEARQNQQTKVATKRQNAEEKKKAKKEFEELLANCPIRRSARNVDKEIKYFDNSVEEQERKDLIAKRRVELLGTTGEAMLLDDTKRVKLERDGGMRGGFDSGRGVRWQGGRIYDSKFGVTCHWCRQKTLEDHVTCTNENCGDGKRMAVSFCKMCLCNRHGEDVLAAEASGVWQCPACRGSCGEGCRLCCNCGPCRKKAGLAPTHQVIKEARAAGIPNVHDYLVWLATGKNAEEISAYKKAHAWGQWLYAEAPAAPAAAEATDEAITDEGTQAAATEPTPAPVAVPKRATRKNKENAAAEANKPLASAKLTNVMQIIKSPQGKPSASKVAAKPMANATAAITEATATEGGPSRAPPISRKARIMARLGLSTAAAH